MQENYFLLGRCVSADAAALFAALLERGSARTFAAADAAFALVTSLFAIGITPTVCFRSSVTRGRPTMIGYLGNCGLSNDTISKLQKYSITNRLCELTFWGCARKIRCHEEN